MQQNFLDPVDNPLSLDRIRSVLVRLEDTIIFGVIERAQFPLNPKIYQRDAFEELKAVGFHGSWLEWFLKEIESFHSKARRYTSPDEYPFSKDLPPPLLPALKFPKILYQHPGCQNINFNPSILSFYTRTIVPRITHRATMQLAARKRVQGIVGDEEYEDDGNYGSAATLDVELLHAISKRVHYGKFVSESKFSKHPSDFIPHILSKDRKALAGLITKPAVEKALLSRLSKKALLYGPDLGIDGEPIRKPRVFAQGHGIPGLTGKSPQVDPEAKTLYPNTRPVSPASPKSSLLSPSSISETLPPDGAPKPAPPVEHEGDQYEWKIDVEDVRNLYEDWIIPLTKEVEVEYLIHRLDGMSESEIEALSRRDDPKAV